MIPLRSGRHHGNRLEETPGRVTDFNQPKAD